MCSELAWPRIHKSGPCSQGSERLIPLACTISQRGERASLHTPTIREARLSGSMTYTLSGISISKEKTHNRLKVRSKVTMAGPIDNFLLLRTLVLP